MDQLEPVQMDEEEEEGDEDLLSECIHNVRFGYQFAKSFVDDVELSFWNTGGQVDFNNYEANNDLWLDEMPLLRQRRDAPRYKAFDRSGNRALMRQRRALFKRDKSRRSLRAWTSLHNFEVGRQVVLRAMEKRCRCHGTPGSCIAQTCWKHIPSVIKVASLLKKSYENAFVLRRPQRRFIREAFMKKQTPPAPLIRDFLQPSSNPWTHETLRTSLAIIGEIDDPNVELIALRRLPNDIFCEPDIEAGILGTHGRECLSQGGNNSINCDHLCCGRGFKEEELLEMEQCECDFIWCCRIECKTCQVKRRVNLCL
ncbi:Wnt16p [Cichlidogyrus casuarinus]|uniref:Protein Wnt n=1 Tax=Cichlidogyrus casuarinus TaxID=1844966 RepID=A0ABD2PUS6_9PLAT